MRQLEIDAAAVEPEFVKINPLGGGAVELNLEFARIHIIEPDGKARRETTGKVSVKLMASDVFNVIARLGELKIDKLSR